MRWQRASATTVALATFVSCAVTFGLASATSAAPTTSAATLPGVFSPVSPCRVLDTRSTAGEQVDEHTIRLQISGHCGVPAEATAVALTLVATQATTGGYLTAYPSTATRPLASVLNFDADDTRANGTVLALSATGAIDIYTSSSAQLIVDTTGYFTPPPGGVAAAGRFVPLTPSRIVDTRSGPVGMLAPAIARTVPLPPSVPPDAVAVAVNLTAVAPVTGGYLSVAAAGASPTETSVLNFPAGGQPRAATVIVPVTAAGFAVLSPAQTHLLVDISGYFTGPSAAVSGDGLLIPLSPTRLLDTRSPSTPLYASGGTEFATPPGAAVAVLNVTLLPAGPGWLAALPAGTSAGIPTVSSVNGGLPNRPVANMAITPTSDRGVELYTAVRAHVVVDLTGYFTGQPTSATLPPRANIKPPNPSVGGCLSGPAELDKTGRWLQQTVNKWGKVGYYSGFGDKGPLVIVGDSLTWQSIIPAMNTLIDRGYGPICVDGVISRWSTTGSSAIPSALVAIARIKSSHSFWTSSAVRWVIGMGTNDVAATNTSASAARARIDAVVAAVGSSYLEVGWINLRTRRGSPWPPREDAFNRQIALTPNVYVIDWSSLVQPSPPTYVWNNDLIHLTPVGQQARSDVIANQLDQH
jgi:hypothetical protein